MKKSSIILLTFSIVIASFSFPGDDLLDVYSRSPSQWPKPHIDPDVKWNELGTLLFAPGEFSTDSMQHIIDLGKILFFDNRLSGSQKISCGTCHKPELSWTDHLPRSSGHEGTINKRNSQTILNSWFYKKLFWDGRSNSLEDQAFSPINSESEMHGDMPGLPRRLKKIKAYPGLFKAAFGSEEIDPDRIASALAQFQRTISSRPSKFDRFLKGDKKAMTKTEIKGLHLFRAKARCMNCHHGPMLTDNDFHNNGIHSAAEVEKDKGYYNVTHDSTDIGRFRTPSLRDVAYTGPWMHSGKAGQLEDIIDHYTRQQLSADPLLKPVKLSKKEKKELIAFLKAVSAPAPAFTLPAIPQ